MQQAGSPARRAGRNTTQATSLTERGRRAGQVALHQGLPGGIRTRPPGEGVTIGGIRTRPPGEGVTIDCIRARPAREGVTIDCIRARPPGEGVTIGRIGSGPTGEGVTVDCIRARPAREGRAIGSIGSGPAGEGVTIDCIRTRPAREGVTVGGIRTRPPGEGVTIAGIRTRPTGEGITIDCIRARPPGEGVTIGGIRTRSPGEGVTIGGIRTRLTGEVVTIGRIGTRPPGEGNAIGARGKSAGPSGDECRRTSCLPGRARECKAHAGRAKEYCNAYHSRGNVSKVHRASPFFNLYSLSSANGQASLTRHQVHAQDTTDVEPVEKRDAFCPRLHRDIDCRPGLRSGSRLLRKPVDGPLVTHLRLMGSRQLMVQVELVLSPHRGLLSSCRSSGFSDSSRRPSTSRPQSAPADGRFPYGNRQNRPRDHPREYAVLPDAPLEAAEAARADDEPAADEVLDGMLRLVDKSLVQPEERNGDVVRYRLLETLHQYA